MSLRSGTDPIPLRGELAWLSADPPLAARRLLRRLGAPDERPGDLRFAGGDAAAPGDILHFAVAPAAGERLVVADDPAADAGSPLVDVPFALAALAIGYPTLPAEIADRALLDEPVLGARGVRATIEGRTLLLLEPTSEGRLAAAVARSGIGPCALYLRAVRGGASSPGPFVAPLVAPPQPGMLGPVRVVPGGPRFGPFVLLLDPGPPMRSSTIAG